jgi:hypothetical protein
VAQAVLTIKLDQSGKAAQPLVRVGEGIASPVSGQSHEPSEPSLGLSEDARKQFLQASVSPSARFSRTGAEVDYWQATSTVNRRALSTIEGRSSFSLSEALLHATSWASRKLATARLDREIDVLWKLTDALGHFQFVELSIYDSNNVRRLVQQWTSTVSWLNRRSELKESCVIARTRQMLPPSPNYRLA